MADLSKLNFKKATSLVTNMKVENPATGGILTNDDGSEWSVDVVGIDSNEYKRAQKTIAEQQINRAMAGRRMNTDAERASVEIAVACTKGWHNLVENGQALVFNEESARELFTRFEWFRDQVCTFVMTRANFVGNL